MPKGSQSELWATILRKHVKEMNPGGGPVPARDSRFLLQSSLRQKDRDLILHRTTLSWSPEQGQFVLSPIQYMFNRERACELHQQSNPDSKNSFYPSATVRGPERCSALGEVTYRPLAAAIRPLNSAYRQVNLEDMEITGKQAKINDLVCIECRIRNGGNESDWPHYWLCASKNYLPVRVSLYHFGKIYMQMEIRYGVSDSSGYRPTSWQVTKLSYTGKIIESISCTVNSWKDQLEDPISSEIPPRTYVYDISKASTPIYYLIREDGSQRLLTRKEQHMPYDALFETVRQETTWLSWSFVSGVLVLVLVVGLLLFIRFWLNRKRTLKVA